MGRRPRTREHETSRTTKPLDHLCAVVRSARPETPPVQSHRHRPQNIVALQTTALRKKQKTMERKKRSKGRGWESCYAKKNPRGRPVSKRERTGRNWSNFANTRGSFSSRPIDNCYRIATYTNGIRRLNYNVYITCLSCKG